jgi:ribose transport system substrate-binding protein
MRNLKPVALLLVMCMLLGITTAFAIDYPDPQPLEAAAQASFDNLKSEGELSVVYMPPATEFNYYMAIGAGIDAQAKELGIKYSMLAPQSGADINGQMTMLQDVIGQAPNMIILSTHDENAAAPLVKQAVNAGILVVIVNSDILNFPTPVHGVVGYSQRNAQRAIGEYAIGLMDGKQALVGIITGQPGWHATERAGGFLDAIEAVKNFEVVSSLDGKWNVEGGNQAAMDMLQAHPEINLMVAGNDYEIMGAQMAAAALNRNDIIFLGNDGDTACLEEIFAGKVTATANTTPFVMGQIVMQVCYDGLKGEFKGGWVETPSTVTDAKNVLPFLQSPDTLFPKPSKAY